MLKFLKIGVFVSLCLVSGTVLAKTSFLPDYVPDNMGRSNDNTRGGGSSAGCSAYGYPTECPEYTVFEGTAIPRPGLTCHKRCVCDTGHFSVTECDAPKVPGGKSCEKDGTKYYENCVCPANYNLRVCPEGAICDKCGDLFKFVSCDTDKGWVRSSGLSVLRGRLCVPAKCPPGYKTGVAACSGDTPDEDCSGYSGGEKCCKCICDNGSSKKCQEDEYPLTAKPVNGSAISCSYGCGSTEVTRYKAVRCDEGYKLQNGVCVPQTCKEVNDKYEASNLVNGKCKEVTTKAGIKCYTDCECNEDYKPDKGQCVAKTCKEVNPELLEACPDGFVGTEVKTKSGRSCYKNCEDPNDPKTVCGAAGYEDSAVSGKICKKVTVNDVACYECSDSPACGTGVLNPADNIVYNSSNKPVALLYNGQYYKPMGYDALYGAGQYFSDYTWGKSSGGTINVQEGMSKAELQAAMLPPKSTLKQLGVFCDYVTSNDDSRKKGLGDHLAGACRGGGGIVLNDGYCNSEKTKIYTKSGTLGNGDAECRDVNDIRDYLIVYQKCSTVKKTCKAGSDEAAEDKLGDKSYSYYYRYCSDKYVKKAKACDSSYDKTRSSATASMNCSSGYKGEACPQDAKKYKCVKSSGGSSSCTNPTSHKNCQQFNCNGFKWCYIPKKCFNTGGGSSECMRQKTGADGRPTMQYESIYQYANCIYGATDANGKSDVNGEYHCCSECNTAQ